MGKHAIREYWTRQWSEFDPRIDVLEVIARENGKTEVKVHQLVINLQGDILADTELSHVYVIHNHLIERMDILEADGNTEGQSAAFAGHGH